MKYVMEALDAFVQEVLHSNEGIHYAKGTWCCQNI